MSSATGRMQSGPVTKLHLPNLVWTPKSLKGIHTAFVRIDYTALEMRMMDFYKKYPAVKRFVEYGKRDAAMVQNFHSLYGRMGRPFEREDVMQVFMVVVWKTQELANGTTKRCEVVQKDGRAVREVLATSAEKAERKVIAELGKAYDAETTEVAVANPFGK